MVDTDYREEVGGQLQESRDGEGEVDGEVEVLDISDMAVKGEIDRHIEDYDDQCVSSQARSPKEINKGERLFTLFILIAQFTKSLINIAVHLQNVTKCHHQ